MTIDEFTMLAAYTRVIASDLERAAQATNQTNAELHRLFANLDRILLMIDDLRQRNQLLEERVSELENKR